MIDDARLRAAYAIDSEEDAKALYRAWASDYDAEFADAHGYVYPAEVARILSASRPEGRTLDIGAGTGLVGVALREAIDTPIDALDLSPEMLAEARAKGIYDRVIEADLNAPLPVDDAAYGALISSGTFTHGHVGAACLPELLRVAAPGARLVLGINFEIFDTAGFGSAFARAVARGALSPVTFVEVPIYRGSAHADADARAAVAVATRL